MNLEEREGTGVEGEETVPKVHCIREGFIFN